jgi:hypothetical protein
MIGFVTQKEIYTNDFHVMFYLCISCFALHISLLAF